MKHARERMLEAVARDVSERFGQSGAPGMAVIAGAYTCSDEEAALWKQEIEDAWPGHDIIMDPLSLSVACHIGPGALAVTASKKLTW